MLDLRTLLILAAAADLILAAALWIGASRGMRDGLAEWGCSLVVRATLGDLLHGQPEAAPPPRAPARADLAAARGDGAARRHGRDCRARLDRAGRRGPGDSVWLPRRGNATPTGRGIDGRSNGARGRPRRRRIQLRRDDARSGRGAGDAGVAGWGLEVAEAFHAGPGHRGLVMPDLRSLPRT